MMQILQATLIKHCSPFKTPILALNFKQMNGDDTNYEKPPSRTYSIQAVTNFTVPYLVESLRDGPCE